MSFLTLLLTVCLSFILPLIPAAEPVRAAEIPALTQVAGVVAPAYVVLDVDRGTFLVEHRADEIREPASLTKVMSALVAVEQAPLGKVGKVSLAAAQTAGNRVGLVAGEKLEMWELLYGALFCSGNDAARALAETVSGSQEAFVAQMNARAAALGLKRTSFVNPHGLPAAGHLSTARELALIGRAALKNETVARIMGRTTRTLPWGGQYRTLHNINKFLYQYRGATGMKTGFTSGAGYCLMASARREGHQLLAVVLGSTSSWQRYQDGMRLLDAGFERLKAVRAGGSAGPGVRGEPVSAKSRWYVLQPGDTVWGLARRLGVGVGDIVKVNPGMNPDQVRAGDRVRLPATGR